MADASERLKRLIELASENAPEKQQALAFELCNLLTDWPDRYPEIMREPFEALLEKVLRRLDEKTRMLIATKLSTNPKSAAGLLHEFYFDVSAEVRGRILAKTRVQNGEPPRRILGEDEKALLQAARAGEEIVPAFAQALRIPAPTARSIVEDPTGDALTVACKGAGMHRATYSALVVITAGLPDGAALRDRLKAFDAIPESGARQMLSYWRRANKPGMRAA